MNLNIILGPKYPVNNGINGLPTDAGFLNHQQYDGNIYTWIFQV